MIKKEYNTDWVVFEKNLLAAKGYHFRAVQFLEEKQRDSLVFNVASVAIECYMIALCAYYGVMPLGHDYRSLVFSLNEVGALNDELAEGIESLDNIFGICSVENYYHGTPEESDSVKSITLCDGLSRIFEKIENDVNVKITSGV